MIFLKKDKHQNYLVFQPNFSVIPISNDTMLWPQKDTIVELYETPVANVVREIRLSESKAALR